MSSERAREREVTKYYQTWLDSSVGFKPRSLSDRFHTDGTGLTSSKDKALLAFAQLGCLRLNVKRGMVTLIATIQQYVLAEATRTLSLASDNQHASGDELWFGNSSLPRSQGVSENALDPASYTAFGPNGETFTAPAFVVNDLTQDERFKQRGYAGKGISFYSGVPITTQSGFPIGVYTLTDDRPRSGLSAEELQFMQDMATIIGEHLDRIRNESARYRGEQMVLGLGAFIEGKSTVYEGRVDVQPSQPDAADSLASPTSEAGNPYEKFRGMTITNADPGALRRAWSSEETYQLVGASQTLSDPACSVKSFPTPNSPAALNEHQQSNNKLINQQNTSPDSSRPRTLKDVLPGMQSKELRQIFWRAATIMRECTAADGVVFYNAMNTNEEKGRSRSNLRHLDIRSVQQSEGSTPGSSDDLRIGHDGALSRSRSVSSDYEKQESGSALQSRDTKSKNCDKLGFSLNISPDSTASEMSITSLSISEHTLRRFIRRYPRGKMFYYTEDGEVSTSDSEWHRARNRENDSRGDSGSAPSMIRQKTSSRALAEELLKVVPGARNVIFLPLWDFNKQKWAAGTFLWSRRPGQLLQAQDDLSYLKAFGNSIMSEIARLDAIKADKAKTSFIANISHELRSPLHGILGSIEFLQDTVVDDFQTSLITSIETCGKTLLDTLNSVLDYAKINHLSRRTRGKSLHFARSGSKGTESHLQNSFTNSLDADFDLAILVEEVVEAIFAGQNSRPVGSLDEIGDIQRSSAEATLPPENASATNGSVPHGSAKSFKSVSLSLDIEHLADWRVHFEPGAIRRLVMNILGNALKYTKRGTIEVSLESTQQCSDASASLSFCLSVADTGKGMSADFAKNHAFTPFIQEDSFASGTGLGLSIVRQIVNSLGGRIDLQSEQDAGTEIKIWLTLPRPRPTSAPEMSVGIMDTVMTETLGLKLCILHPDFPEQDPSIHGQEGQVTDPVEKSIQNLAQEWFQMDVLTPSRVDENIADFFIYTEPPPIEDLLERHGQPAREEEVPFIIIAANAFETASLRASCLSHLTKSGRVLEIISQPCGPQKLAKAIHRCFRRLEKLREDLTGSQASNPGQTQVRDSPELSASETDVRATPPRLGEPRGENESTNGKQASFPRLQRPQKALNGTTSNLPSDHQANLRTRLTPPDKTDSASGTNASDSDIAAIASDKAPILLVDDNEINLKLLVAFVKKARYSYECAQDGLQALEAYKRASADPNRAFRCVLMDVSMPVMDGLAATREIRNFEKKNNIVPTVIIALTGVASESTQNDAFHSGVDYFQIKPAKFRDLLKMLEH